jgi:hypothetical protein
VRESESIGVVEVVADGSGAAIAGSVGVAGNGIVARGAGVETRVAPAMSDVVRFAKCPAVRPPVLQRT